MAKSTNLKNINLDKIFKLRISLNGTEPPVWRELLVPANFSLEALHSVLQIVMGWQMSHLYEFIVGDQRYTEPDEFMDFPSKKPKPVTTKLMAALKQENQFSYIYDFGDGWIHTVKVLEIIDIENMYNYPVCIGGQNACPPEDCGGIPGFDQLKKKINNKKDPEYLELLSWIGGYYDPTTFDANRINRDMLWVIDWTKKSNSQGLYLPFNAES